LLTIISDYLQDSIALAKATYPDAFRSEEFVEFYAKHFHAMGENPFISKMLPQITVRLQQDDNLFSPDFYQIHFKNGYVDKKLDLLLKKNKITVGLNPRCIVYLCIISC
jgi:UDP-galactopyranose mutase